jgi:hypothetical protein
MEVFQIEKVAEEFGLRIEYNRETFIFTVIFGSDTVVYATQSKKKLQGFVEGWQAGWRNKDQETKYTTAL